MGEFVGARGFKHRPPANIDYGDDNNCELLDVLKHLPGDFVTCKLGTQEPDLNDKKVSDTVFSSKEMVGARGFEAPTDLCNPIQRSKARSNDLSLVHEAR